jgi:hypothetical protein
MEMWQSYMQKCNKTNENDVKMLTGFNRLSVENRGSYVNAVMNILASQKEGISSLQR